MWGKTKWKRKERSKKKKQNEDLLTKTAKLISFFQVVDKDVGSSSDDVDDKSFPISPESVTATEVQFQIKLYQMMLAFLVL